MNFFAILAAATGFLGEAGKFAEGVRPWISTGALVALAGLCVNFYLKNKKMEVDTEGGIRDHYAKEVASLRKQLIDVQALSDQRIASAEKRYSEAVRAADDRHRSCEQECDRLRQKVTGLERQIEQIHRASLKLFALREDLPEETKETLRSLEQAATSIDVPPRRKRRFSR